MTATTHSTALAPIQPSFTDAERLALAGFLADGQMPARTGQDLRSPKPRPRTLPRIPRSPI